MHKYRSIGVCLSSALLFLTCVSVLSLTLPSASAEESVVTDVTLSVPVSCSMSGTGMESHNAEVVNGRTQENIGLTTIKAYCNDTSGFAIYAIGFTDYTYGNTVLTDDELGSSYDIATSSTVVDATSSWSMKLAATSGTYTPIIAGSSADTEKETGDPDFTSYQAVPTNYTRVAYRASSTDIGSSATGSTITTTYRAHISPTQAAGNYAGLVKYTLVHPSFVTSDAFEDAVTVNFNGNGLTFPDGSSTNQVKYAKVCEPGGYGYVGSNYQEVMTSNITTGGAQSGPYTDSENVLRTITMPNADKVKVVVDYGVTANTARLAVIEGVYEIGDGEPERYTMIIPDDDITGIKSYTFDGDTVTILINSNAAPTTGYDKGFYIKAYPVYNTEQANTTREKLPSGNCSIRIIQGSYAETTTWKGKWTATINEEEVAFEDGCIGFYESCNYATTAEEKVSRYIKNYYDSVKGTTLSLDAHNPYYLRYNGNGASNEFGMGIHQDFSRDWGYYNRELRSGNDIILVAPNFKRTGYGFIGWSTDANAANHLSTATLYGPDQTITIDNSLLSMANNERIVNLYAIWLPSAGNLQNWSGCSSMSIGDVTALTDTRDNDTYAVAKLADGKCWMIENLRLGGNSPITLTVSDSQSAGVLPAASTASSWDTSATVQNINAENTLSLDQSVTVIRNSNNYSFGNYYTWAAAINTTAQINDSDVSTSICPSGWSLPPRADYQYLVSSIDGDDSAVLRSYPNNYVLSGYATSGTHHFNIENTWVIFSNYWTASSSNTVGASQFYITDTDCGFSTIVNPYTYNSGSKSIGRSVRCVLQTVNQ